VASTSVRALTALAASTIASRSAVRPDWDWTRLKATSVVPGSMRSARRSNGTSWTWTPRSRAATRIGNSSEVNSSSGTTTRSAGVSEAAMVPTPTDADGTSATLCAGTPISAPNDARHASPHTSQARTQSAVPACHASTARCIASTVGRGGSP
jgi:hypothetical protein